MGSYDPPPSASLVAGITVTYHNTWQNSRFFPILSTFSAILINDFISNLIQLHFFIPRWGHYLCGSRWGLYSNFWQRNRGKNKEGVDSMHNYLSRKLPENYHQFLSFSFSLFVWFGLVLRQGFTMHPRLPSN
jgi:hypothetical protein